MAISRSAVAASDGNDAVSRPRGALYVGRLAGTAVSVHASGLVTLMVFLWFATQRMRMPLLMSMLGGNELWVGPWTWGALLTGALAASLVLHQAAHLILARLVGGRPACLTLLHLGGCAILEGPEARWRRALVVVAGPAATLLVGGALCGAAYLLQLRVEVRAALWLLGQALVFLGAIDLVPAPPLDGGRLVQMALEARVGRARALGIVTQLGRAVAVAVAVAGVAWASLPLIAVAAVLWAGAASSGAAGAAGTAGPLGARTVGELAQTLAPVSAEASLFEAARRMRRERRAVLVVIESTQEVHREASSSLCEFGALEAARPSRARRLEAGRLEAGHVEAGPQDDVRVLGILEARDVARVAATARAHARVRELVRRVPVLDVRELAEHGRDLLRALRVSALPVLAAGVPVGLLEQHTIEVAAVLASLGDGGDASARLCSPSGVGYKRGTYATCPAPESPAGSLLRPAPAVGLWGRRFWYRTGGHRRRRVGGIGRHRHAHRGGRRV